MTPILVTYYACRLKTRMGDDLFRIDTLAKSLTPSWRRGGSLHPPQKPHSRSPWPSAAARSYGLLRLPRRLLRFCCGNDPLRNFSMLAGIIKEFQDSKWKEKSSCMVRGSRRRGKWSMGKGYSPPQPTRGLRERRELPQRGPGRSPGRKRFCCVLRALERFSLSCMLLK